MAAENNEMDQLKSEIERLNRELDQASSEKIQSAQYGLGLLDEKSQLQQKCEDLEHAYETTRHELEITQEVTIINFIDVVVDNSYVCRNYIIKSFNLDRCIFYILIFYHGYFVL